MNIYSDTSEFYGDKFCHIIFHHSGKEKLSVVERQQLITPPEHTHKTLHWRSLFYQSGKNVNVFPKCICNVKKSCSCTLHVRNILQIGQYEDFEIHAF